ncbi:hypothetical protein WOLCODRAFT_159864 [Wolfiporia cocos MD-104 SS10]|uniref:Kinetochore protein SPC25 n=1 Tax=Wolfiporia cocos (strain MD-104) TaxID=742152 RepID=A0A2H3IT42_WOLCO|nr:hypothetical protein WOLCODRAFT_159864 [Wolfiporia cocos MD-104 SS10]
MAKNKTPRAPRFDLAAALSSPNPHIDLKLEAFEASTRNFLDAVSRYTHRGIAEITSRKSSHSSDRKQYAERMQQVEIETNICKLKEIELIEVLNREQTEKREAESSVATFRRQLNAVKEICASLDGETEQYRMVTANLRREREGESALLNAHGTNVIPEAVDCQARLQFLIEGISKDNILLRFTSIDSRDHTRDFNLVLDVSSRSYRVPTTTPFVPTLPIMIDELNVTRDIYTFIKAVRQVFKELCVG